MISRLATRIYAAAVNFRTMPDQRAISSPPPPPVSPPPSANASRSARPPQFSVRTLLAAMTLLAVLLALLPYSGIPVAALILGVALLLMIPVCLATLAIYSRGHRQTFFLGLLAGALAPYFLGARGMRGGDPFEWAFWLVLQSTAAAACGFTALVTRRFVERRGWHLPADRDRTNRRS